MIRRYKWEACNASHLNRTVGAAVVCVAITPIYVDQQVDAARAADLDDAMSGQGWAFVEEDPATPIPGT